MSEQAVAGPTGTTISASLRQGMPWDHEEHCQLVDEIRAGLTWQDIAAAHARTEKAVLARASLMMAGENLPRSQVQRAAALREALALDPNYDWQGPLHRHVPGKIWSARDDERLADAWRTSTPLVSLAAELETSERIVVRRLITLKLADGMVEATDQLGFTPGGFLESSRQFAKDPAYLRLWVVVGANAEGTIKHLTLHASRAGAEELVSNRADDPLTWTVVQRGLSPDE